MNQFMTAVFAAALAFSAGTAGATEYFQDFTSGTTGFNHPVGAADYNYIRLYPGSYAANDTVRVELRFGGGVVPIESNLNFSYRNSYTYYDVLCPTPGCGNEANVFIDYDISDFDSSVPGLLSFTLQTPRDRAVNCADEHPDFSVSTHCVDTYSGGSSYLRFAFQIEGGTPTGEGDFVTCPTCYASLSIKSVTPEPATWAMLVLGFGIAGGRLRRRYARLSNA